MHHSPPFGWRWAAVTALSLALAACGGSDSDDASPDSPTPVPEQPAPPSAPVPKFTYTPDPDVCAWMQAHVPPFEWPADRVGPRNWPEVAPIVTYAHPVRNEQGVPRYTLTSNNWVRTERYGPQARALNILEPGWRVWAQQVACDHGLVVEPMHDFMLSAYMSDEVAARIAHESYAGRLSQTDLCAPSGFVFSGMQPPTLPPECDAPAR